MYPKKSLGQHFLRSETALRKIVDAAELTKGDSVLEVGPGEGNLTEKLLEKAGRVAAVEKDNRLIEFLQKKFATEITTGKLVLVHDDILRFDPSGFRFQVSGFKLVANIPYYITGKLLRKFLSGDCQPSRMVLLVQREVAGRVVARDNKESLLSLSVKAYGHPRVIAQVPAGAFTPRPKVDSAILLIENISRNRFKNHEEEEKFFQLIHAGFAHRRKLLIANLRSKIKPSKVSTWQVDTLDGKIFAGCGIPRNARAEDLSLEKWLCLGGK